MSNIEITLPDGSKQSVAAETRPIDIARGISPRLADAAIAAKVNGEMFDLTRPIEQDATLQILTAKNPESLEVYRHSTAHLLAAAVLELYPETKLGIGPPIENGFYYDFDRPTPFTPDDLEKIEKKMWEIQARDLPYERVLTPKDEGLQKYSEAWMKCELITEKAGDVFTEYTLGPALHRFLPRPARPRHLEDQGLQAALHRRRLLEGRREEQAAAAHLRHRLLLQEGSRRLSQAGSKRPRSATTASSARNSTSSASRNSPAPD